MKLRKGDRVRKTNSKPKDLHKDGDMATVSRVTPGRLYVRWDDAPHIDLTIGATRIAPLPRHRKNRPEAAKPKAKKA